ncbi:MAG: family 78 glycoside hydrolase catalytic domain [Cytophagales bacterium]|nr:family 78 glycoside hydrolase catalytic domain [Cytophagales bacterium]
MRLCLLLLCCLIASSLRAATPPASPARPVALRCEYRENPLGLDARQPQLSWQLRDNRRGAAQRAYQVLVASSPKLLHPNGADVWNSGKINSDESARVAYGGKALQSRQRYYWKVKFWDQDGRESAWSEAAWWEMGLLDAGDWQAEWIGKDLNPPVPAVSPGNWVWHPQDRGKWHMVYLRKTFQVPAGKALRRATVYAAVDDSYELTLNSQPVGSVRNFAPMRGLQFHAYEATQWIRAGANTMHLAGVFTGKRPNGRGGAVMTLMLAYEDGTTEAIRTDGSWEAAVNDSTGWRTEAPTATTWTPVKVLEPLDGPIFGKVAPAYVAPRAIRVRKEFSLPKKLRRARAYVTGLGGYYLHLNGRTVSRDLLAPGWTNYYKRIQYQVYDVTSLLKSGPNAVGAELGNLWWSGDVGYRGMAQYAQGPLRFLLQLHLTYEDGTEETLRTDPTWKVHASPITFNSIYDGESCDARLETPGWDRAGFPDTGWQAAETIREKRDVLVAEQVEPIRATQEITPVSVKPLKPGTFVFDLGQNIAGWVRLKVQGPAGTKVTLRFAEILNEDGSLKTEPLRTAKATDEYILRGGAAETWEPRFTYHGFQFVEVTGFPGTPDTNAVTGVVLHTDAPERGRFACANSLINQIQSNITWGLRGNMHSVVTDCPQRDERMGWTGDAQIFAMTASYNRDMTLMFRKYMCDLADSQVPDGNVCNVNPNAFEEGAAPAGWADAVVIVPWRVYQFTGDKRILEENYPVMTKWHAQKQRESKDYLRESWTFGDWVSVEQTPELPISAMYHYYSTKLLGRIAAELGKGEEAQRYDQLAARIARACNEKYLDKRSFSYATGTQTANLLPLAFGLPAPAEAPRVAQNVADNVKERENHLTTGFLGTQYILPVLSDYGYHDLAYQLATQRTYPSWGYMVDKGATTIWELWNSDQQGPDMNSRNHYAYGTVGEWFFGYLAGIRPDEGAPGFKRILIAPQPAGDLAWAEGTVETPYGPVKSRWDRKGNGLTLNVTVPANATAQIRLPNLGNQALTVTENGKTLLNAGTPSGTVPFIEVTKVDEAGATLQVGAGSYAFTIL